MLNAGNKLEHTEEPANSPATSPTVRAAKKHESETVATAFIGINMKHCYKSFPFNCFPKIVQVNAI